MTIAGPPGIGKTRLAQQYAGGVAGGHLWVALGSEDAGDGLPAAVARRLGVEIADAGDADVIERRVRVALAERGSLLVVLDNIDAAVGTAVPVLARWVDTLPEVAFLVTSCQVLRVRSETILTLGPLRLPPAETATLDALLASEAGRFFANHSDRALHDGDAGAVAEIVRRLDGIPLALELAARRLAVLEPAQLLARLSERFAVLTAGPRDAEARHATLRAAIDWSWSHLDARERSALAQCAVFRGGFTPAAAEQVVRPAPAGGPPVLDVIQSLVEKSFLRGHRTRLALYDTIRDYARARSDTALDRGAAAARHRAYFGRLARERSAEAAAEIENLIAAWHNSAREPPTRELVELEADVLLVLERGILSRKPVSDLVHMVDATLDRASDVAVRDEVRADLLVTRSLGLQTMGSLDAARRDLERAAALAAPDGPVWARAHWRLGILARTVGHGDASASHLRRALAAARAAGGDELVAEILTQLAYLEVSRFRLDDAAAYVAGAAAVARDAGGNRLRATVDNARLLVAMRAQRHDDALDAYDRAHRALVELGRSWQAAYADINAALVHQERGDFTVAGELLERAARTGRQLGVKRIEGLALGNLAAVLHEQGELKAARARYAQAVERLGDAGNLPLQAEFLAHFGALLAMRDEVLLAGQKLDRARALVAAADGPLGSAFSVFAAQLDLARARAAADEGAAEVVGHRQAAFRRLGVDPTEPAEMRAGWGAARTAAGAASSETLRFAIRLMKRALDRTFVVVEPAGAWLRAPGKRRGDLRTRSALQRLLAVLLERYLAAPGQIVHRDELIAAGWPDERMSDESAINRLKTAISSLRKYGLGDRVAHHDAGYLLDARASFVPAGWVSR